MPSSVAKIVSEIMECALIGITVIDMRWLQEPARVSRDLDYKTCSICHRLIHLLLAEYQ